MAKRARFYVTVNHDSTWRIIKSECKPTPNECLDFFGPFTKREALFMAVEGPSNPVCSTTQDAKIMAKRKWNDADANMAEIMYSLIMGGV